VKSASRHPSNDEVRFVRTKPSLASIQDEIPGYSRGPLQSAFPNLTYSPVAGFQPKDSLKVALPVFADLRPPEIFAAARPFEEMAVMPVPKTTVSEQNRPVFWKY
jgi:hypothetical protein